MARAKTDKLKCRTCRQSPPLVQIRHAKGKPLGECLDCARKLKQAGRLRRAFALGLYQSVPELVAANLKALAALQPGAYALRLNTTKAREGYLVVKRGAIYVEIWNDFALLEYRLFEIASYLGNMNVFIDPSPIDVLDGDSRPLALESIGAGMPLESPAERLIWYDPALLSKAIQLVKDEARNARRLNMALARSKNPNTKPSPNEA